MPPLSASSVVPVRRRPAVLAGLALVAVLARGAGAQTVNVVVPGTSDPWLAGMPAGSTASFGDFAPAQSPVQVLGLNFAGGGTLTFTVTGSVNNVPGPSGLGPDGGSVTPHTSGAQNGISDVSAPVNSLVGVFLTGAQPSLTAAPGALDFSTSLSQNYLSLAPGLKQVFFIGDGRTSGLAVQQIVIPAGATRFYLGTMDGFEWANNDGAFNASVTLTGPQAVVPEPSAWALVAAGLGALGGIVRRRRAA